MFRRDREEGKKKLELLVFASVRCKTGGAKNEPKLLEKGKLQRYGTDKTVHCHCSIKLYFINAFSEKSLIFLISLIKAS